MAGGPGGGAERRICRPEDLPVPTCSTAAKSPLSLPWVSPWIFRSTTTPAVLPHLLDLYRGIKYK